MIKAVIFDMDGVIIDTKRQHYEAWKIFWKKRGIKHSWKDFIKYFGMPNKNIFPILYKNISEKEVEKLSEEKERYFREISKGRMKPANGAERLLKDLRKWQFKIALATSTPKSNMNFIMNEIKLKKYFDTVITAFDIRHGKPNPEIFLKAAKRLRIKPENCVVIEDTLHGIEAAKRAKMKCIAVATTYKAAELKTADLVRKDISRIEIADIR